MCVWIGGVVMICATKKEIGPTRCERSADLEPVQVESRASGHGETLLAHTVCQMEKSCRYIGERRESRQHEPT